MLAEAADCEAQFGEGLLCHGVAGLSLADMCGYLEHVADRRLAPLGLPRCTRRPTRWRSWTCKDAPELSNLFERRVSANQVGVTGEVAFDDF